VADIFLLSCRALGRGVEHDMIQTLALHAERFGCGRIAVDHITGPRNTPVRRFLASLNDTALPDKGRLVLSTDAAGQILFRPTEAQPTDEAPPAGTANGASAIDAGTKAVDRGAVFTWIAAEMTTGAAILAAMRGGVRPRPDLNTPYLAPGAGNEAAIAQIWAEVLGFEKIGATDLFKDLGGRSIDLVRVHGLLTKRLGLQLDIADLFRFGTVRTLAAYLATSAVSPADQQALTQANAARAELMKNAKSSVAARRRRSASPRPA
jgi:acyl carrier protein